MGVHLPVLLFACLSYWRQTDTLYKIRYTHIGPQLLVLRTRLNWVKINAIISGFTRIKTILESLHRSNAVSLTRCSDTSYTTSSHLWFADLFLCNFLRRRADSTQSIQLFCRNVYHTLGHMTELDRSFDRIVAVIRHATPFCALRHFWNALAQNWNSWLSQDAAFAS